MPPWEILSCCFFFGGGGSQRCLVSVFQVPGIHPPKWASQIHRMSPRPGSCFKKTPTMKSSKLCVSYKLANYTTPPTQVVPLNLGFLSYFWTRMKKGTPLTTKIEIKIKTSVPYVCLLTLPNNFLFSTLAPPTCWIYHLSGIKSHMASWKNHHLQWKITFKKKNMTFTWKYIFMYGPFCSHVKDLPTAFLRKVPNPQEDVFMEPWIAKQPLSLPPNSASEKTTKRLCTLCTVATKM